MQTASGMTMTAAGSERIGVRSPQLASIAGIEAWPTTMAAISTSQSANASEVARPAGDSRSTMMRTGLCWPPR